MKLFIDVNKLPRPERSGVISMLVLYLALQGYGDIINAPYMMAAEHWSDLLCYVLPCSLFSHPPEKERAEPRQRHYRLTPLTFGSGKGKPICACHVDITNSGQKVRHIHWMQEPTCDSDYPSLEERSRSYTAPEPAPITVTTMGTEVYMVTDGEVHWHCTAGKD